MSRNYFCSNNRLCKTIYTNFYFFGGGGGEGRGSENSFLLRVDYRVMPQSKNYCLEHIADTHCHRQRKHYL